MPLILNVGLSKKIGEPNYGSKGASVNLQLEVDTTLVEQPGQLQARIRELFAQAREAVEAELFGRDATNGASHNGSLPTNGNGHRSNGRQATASQVRAIHAIANRQRIDLVQLLSQRFQIGRPEGLSVSEASGLIDELKQEPAGNGGGRSFWIPTVRM